MTNKKKLKVILAGRSERSLRSHAEMLSNVADVSCSIQRTSGGEADTLSGLEPLPDMLVLHFDEDSLSELAALADSSPDSRPPLILVGPAGNAEAMRLAVRSGARDFLAEPVEAAELVAAVERLRDAISREAAGPHRSDLIVCLGVAGGVGTSMVACNLAVALASEQAASTLLLDLDLNAAPLASFLDLAPERGLPSVLAEVEFLDAEALQGYVAKHRSGLRLMGMPAASRVAARDIDVLRFGSLMSILAANYRYLVADASYRLDDLTVETLGMAKTVILVLQQSVVQVKQATRLLGTLCNDVGIGSDRIKIVVNRYLKRSTVALDDIRRALGREQLLVVPTQYRSVLASIDGGIPLIESDRSSAVARAILDLESEIVGGPHVSRPGLLRRALPIFSGD